MSEHLFSCVTYYFHITSRRLDIRWNTVSHIWYIKSRLRNVASPEEKKKEKKETETCVINWKKRDVFSNCRPLCNFCQCDQILVFHPLTRWPCQWSIQLYVFFENHQHSSSNGLLLVGRVPKYKGHVYPTILLPTKPSKKRFTIQLEDYKIELSLKVYACPLITRMRGTPWVEFSRTFINTVADWSEMKTCQTGYSVNQFFSRFSSPPRGSIFQKFARKTEMEWQVIVRLMMVFRLRN